MKRQSLRVLAVDDHALVRRGLRDLLEDEYAELIFGEAENAHAALDQVWRTSWDVIILDITLPGRSGLDILREITAAQPSAAILVQSMHAEGQFAIQALRSGAAGYITKMSMPEELVRAVETVLKGEKYICASLPQNLLTAQAGKQPLP